MTGSINFLEGILQKYKQQLDEVDENRTKICEIIKNVTGVKVVVKEIEIAEHVLMIKAHPAKRQIIMFNKHELLSEIQNIEKLKNILEIK